MGQPRVRVAHHVDVGRAAAAARIRRPGVLARGDLGPLAEHRLQRLPRPASGRDVGEAGLVQPVVARKGRSTRSVPRRTATHPDPGRPAHLCADAVSTSQRRGAARGPARPPRRPAGTPPGSSASSTGCSVPTSWLAAWRATAPTPATPPIASRDGPPRRGRPPRPGRGRSRATAPRAGPRSARPRRGRSGPVAAARPSRPRCTAPVPDEVKPTSSGCAPRASATTARALSREQPRRPGTVERRGSAYPGRGRRAGSPVPGGCRGRASRGRTRGAAHIALHDTTTPEGDLRRSETFHPTRLPGVA